MFTLLYEFARLTPAPSIDDAVANDNDDAAFLLVVVSRCDARLTLPSSVLSDDVVVACEHFAVFVVPLQDVPPPPHEPVLLLATPIELLQPLINVDEVVVVVVRVVELICFICRRKKMVFWSEQIE